MNIRKIALAVVTIATLSPAISNAATEQASAKACAHAFATSIAAPGAAVAPAYKFAYSGNFGGGLTAFYPTDYTFTLEAHDSKTGAAVARARCSTNVHGIVTELATIPLEVKSETLAARF